MAQPIAAAVAAELRVSEQPDGLIEVDTGPLRFGIASGPRATIRQVAVDGKAVVAGNHEPLLEAVVMESREVTPWRDFLPGRVVLAADYAARSVTCSQQNGVFEALIAGCLNFHQGDQLPFEIRILAFAGSPRLEIQTRLGMQGKFAGRMLRSVGLRLPLALQWRKRVAQGGDQGLEWDTRYYYEFPGRSGIMPEPDRNEFRWFGVEHEAPNFFRVWRAESASTPEMVHQTGRFAAGWCSVYDREGGVLFALREMAATAPKTLEVDAARGGEAVVWLHPPSRPAFHPTDNELAAPAFDRWHRTDWIFYTGEHPESFPDRLLAEIWGEPAPLHGRRPERGFKDLWDAGIDLWTTPAVAAGNEPFVSGGIPLPRGALRPDLPVGLYGPDGAMPVQQRPLAFWPDGSVKWLHLVFPFTAATNSDRADNGMDVARELAARQPAAGIEEFTVSQRDGEPVRFALLHGGQPGTPDCARQVHVETLEADADGNPVRVRVATGPLEAELGIGENWLGKVLLNERPVWREGAQGARAFVDFVRPPCNYPARTTHPEGLHDPGPVHMEKIEIEESGPMRAVIRLQGRALCQEPADVVLRLEFHAGRPWVRVAHTVEFNQGDPRRVFVSGMGLTLPLAPGAGRLLAGGEDGPVVLEAGASAALRQHSHGSYGILQRRDAATESIETGSRCRGWMDAAGETAGLTLAVRNMWQDAPKEIEWDEASGDLTAWLWPASFRLMDVRRYSNFPHLAQGESVSASNDWVEKVYYGPDNAPNDPFAGTSRTHELLLIFHDGMAPATISAAVADFQSPPLVFSGYDRYRETGVTVPLPDMDQFPNIATNLDNFTAFWLFHQRYWGWYGFWDHGDFQHRFRSGGYGWKVAPERLAEYLRISPAQRPQFQNAGELILDYSPQQDWLFDNGRWGWTNTEGLPGLYFQQEYLRTGRRDVFFAAEALARHARDVVTRQSGKFFGKGTRHGVQHWSDGNHEERQATFAEYRLHYYLTGEGRSRDVMEKLGDYYLRGRVRRADHSGRIYGLFTRWEMTGEARFGDLIRDYLHSMVTPDGFSGYADLTLADGKVRVNDIEEGINTRSMFFHNFGALHGVIEYCRATNDEVVRDALVRSARASLRPGASLQQGSASFGLLAGFAAPHETDGGCLKELIVEDMSNPGTGSRDAFQMVTRNPLFWTGPGARLSRQVPVCWFYMVALPVILEAVEKEPKLPQRIWDRFAAENDASRPDGAGNPFRPRVSWQDEYDALELEEYFSPWRPAR